HPGVPHLRIFGRGGLRPGHNSRPATPPRRYRKGTGRVKIFNREMGGGKTTALLELMDRPENSSVVYVAPTKRQADMARSMFETMTGKKPDPDRFVSASQLPRSNPGGAYPDTRYVIDELEGVIDYLAGG